MSGGTFFPNTEAEQVVWLSHYALKIPIHGPICGISDTEIQATLKDIAYWVWMLQHWHPATQHDAKESTAHKLRMISGSGTGSTNHPQPTLFPDQPPIPEPGIQKCLFSQIARIKASPAFNESIWHDLGGYRHDHYNRSSRPRIHGNRGNGRDRPSRPHRLQEIWT